MDSYTDRKAYNEEAVENEDDTILVDFETYKLVTVALRTIILELGEQEQFKHATGRMTYSYLLDKLGYPMASWI